MTRLTAIVGGAFVGFIVFGVIGFIGDHLAEGQPAWVEVVAVLISGFVGLAAGRSSYVASMRHGRGSRPAI